MSAIERLHKARKTLKQRNIDAAIITNLPNVRYLTGFTGTSGAVVISSRKAFFVSDFRYQEQTKQEISGYEIEIYKDSFETYLQSLLKRIKCGVVGFEAGFVSCDQLKRWSSKIRAEWTPLNCLIEDLRLIKDEVEISKIKKATEITDRAFSYITNCIKPGISEREIAIELEYFLRKQGADKIAFEFIVASGERSALPHATSSGNEIKTNSFVVIDMGAVYEGYCSDLSRTIFVGKPKKEDFNIYEAVQEAQERAIDAIACGKKAREIDRVARDYLAKENLNKYFGHNLGHGVGLEVHEAPSLGSRSENILEEGMVFTVEPGVYIPGKGGVRIEDLVLLKKNGIDILTKSPKELITI